MPRFAYAFGSLLLCIVVLCCWGMAQAATNNFTWGYTQGIDPAVGVRIYKQLGCIGPFTIVQTQSIALHTWSDPNIPSGQINCYFVTAVDAQGNESPQGQAIQVPQQPVGVSDFRGSQVP